MRPVARAGEIGRGLAGGGAGLCVVGVGDNGAFVAVVFASKVLPFLFAVLFFFFLLVLLRSSSPPHPFTTCFVLPVVLRIFPSTPPGPTPKVCFRLMWWLVVA